MFSEASNLLNRNYNGRIQIRKGVLKEPLNGNVQRKSRGKLGRMDEHVARVAIQNMRNYYKSWKSLAKCSLLNEWILLLFQYIFQRWQARPIVKYDKRLVDVGGVLLFLFNDELWEEKLCINKITSIFIIKSSDLEI